MAVIFASDNAVMLLGSSAVEWVSVIGDTTWFGYRMLRPCVWLEIVCGCIKEAGGEVGGACLEWKCVETVKGIQQVTVIGTLLVDNKVVEVPLDVKLNICLWIKIE